MKSSQPQNQEAERGRAGVIYALAAFLSWGFLPFYFKAVAAVPSLEVLAHRVIWSLVFLLALTLVRGRWGAFIALFRSRRTQLTLMTTTVLIAVNWGVFIWAVVNGHLVEASLGYFITPLINVVLGVLFLRERLRPAQLAAVMLAAGGIAWMTANLGHPPVISLTLAVSFGFYGLLRKQVPASGIQGLTAETLMLSPVAVGWMIWRRQQGDLIFLHGNLRLDLLLISAGLLTALPLIWFAEGARRLRLATLGFLQYLAPSFQLLLAVAFFGEAFTRDHAVSFGLIWIALGLYTTDTLRGLRPAPPKLITPLNR
jgi:chloramphenicol-sensitive protein RarD